MSKPKLFTDNMLYHCYVMPGNTSEADTRRTVGGLKTKKSEKRIYPIAQSVEKLRNKLSRSRFSTRLVLS